MTHEGTATLPRGRPLSEKDLDRIRDSVDDGHRYELIDGVLIVSPGPGFNHQRSLGSLYRAFAEACPDDLEVFFAPFDLRLAIDTVMQPDLIVFRTADATDDNLPVAPVLAIEVLSPSTRSFDLHTKKDRFRRAGCAHYWVVDPLIPSVTAWRLQGEGEAAEYAVAGSASGDEELSLADPFDIRIIPQRLIER